ncbi:MAG: UDP-N-acetylmuramoyl-L-alanyl-D-glutamate--2,6-diaminopimelate ligase [Pseudoflavonifractor sp.]
MLRPRLPLGDYYQLLLKAGLLCDAAPLKTDLGRPVALVSCDSKNVLPDTLFICKGAGFQPEYLRVAAEKGALAYVSERVFAGAPLPCILVRDIRRAMALLADLAWGHPSGALQVVGITGTKGKTTAAYYLNAILDAHRAAQGLRPTALLSTIHTDDGAERRPATLTTPEPLDLQRHLWNAAHAGCDYLTMEVSSQALKYHRVTGVDFSVAVFLNIGEDHISPHEHPDFQDYFASKLLIFQRAKTACVNLDAEHAQEILAAAHCCGRTITFSRQDPAADVFGDAIRREHEKTCFTVRTPRYRAELNMPMPGIFNVENALAAIAAAEALDLPPDAVRQGLQDATVPGRMEPYASADGSRVVIVDYAHNGMSLRALLGAVRRDYPGRQMTVLFGCTGGKGLDRRAGMGSAAGDLADRIILTEDDPAEESVSDICREIGRSIGGKDYTVLENREEAVAEAIFGARAPAVIVLAGKGSEQLQKRKNGAEPCVPDGLLARKVLTAYDKRGI